MASRHPFVVDAVLAGAILFLALPWATEEGFRRPDALAVLLIVAQTAPLAWRRRAPAVVLAVITGALCVHVALDYQPGAGLFALVIAVYTVFARYPRSRWAGRTVLACAVATLAASLPSGGRVDAQEFWGAVVVFGVPWLIGARVYASRAYTAELEERTAALEREQEAAARRAVADERARLARELHDVVAHAISVMIVQATAAQRVMRHSPDRAQEALGAIDSLGRQALGEMRRLLEVLRKDDGTETLEPQPGVAQLERLLGQVGQAGLAVDLEVEGEARPLPPGIDLSAYRIVQEALTNALKHAGPTRAEVLVRYGQRSLELTIRDYGSATGPRNGVPGPGHGLAGMRERVALLGGTITAGPAEPKGYEVHVELPLDREHA